MHFTLETQKVRSYLLCVGLNSINGCPQHASTCTRILIGMVIDPVHGIICTRLLLFITVLKIFLSRIG